MMRSMFSAVSGLKTHQIRMDVIGNNIANVNTIGFKTGRVNFQEMFSQTMRGASAPTGESGGTNPQQVGLGVALSSVDTIQGQGNLQSTAKTTDLAIQGNGFFVVEDGGTRMFTRAGMFDLDSQGNLVDQGGRRVQGWMATNGVFGSKDTATLSDITVPVGQVIQATPTTMVEWGHNLDAGAAVGFTRTTSVDVLDSLGRSHSISMSFRRTDGARESGNIDWGGNLLTGSGSYVATFDAYDDLGVAHSITVTFTEVDVDTWSWTATGPAGIADNTGQIEFSGGAWLSQSGGPVRFTPTGASEVVLDMDFSGLQLGATNNAAATTDGAAAGTVSNEWSWTASGPAGLTNNTGTIVFDTNGAVLTADIGPLAFNPVGAEPMSVTMDFDRVTQNGGESTLEFIDRNGSPMGTLGKITIDGEGVITGTYSNGESQQIGQLCVANFANPGGLLRLGDNLYVSSNNSGPEQIGEAGTGGRGDIKPSALEMSNVDLAEEFTSMIVTQRGFQANSRVITASDEMLQDLVNLKR
ncbi:MAG: flagellar hook protein FlgE [Ignavibacteriales bacterium]